MDTSERRGTTRSTPVLNLPTPVEHFVFENRSYFLKRDDRISRDFSGNKARKFLYYLRRDFPKVRHLVSHGSIQSNAMYSLSVLARMRGWSFDYYVSHIPPALRRSPTGNYRRALENGISLRIGTPPDHVRKDPSVLFIPEGGHAEQAREGIEELAEEIKQWKRSEGIGRLNVFLPSGRGTTALYLARALEPDGVKVLTTPCAGDARELRGQWAILDSDASYRPDILDLRKRYRFGGLYPEFYEIWLKLRDEGGVEFDLLYDPKGWLVLDTMASRIEGPILYLHQGGLLGNESMLERYRQKFAETPAHGKREKR